MNPSIHVNLGIAFTILILRVFLSHLQTNNHMSEKQKKATAYWKENVRYLFILLTIWFAVSYGAGIIFKDALNAINLGGFKLGFWFAQQGAIYVFVILIFIYVRLMNKLDKKYGYDE